MPAGEAQALCWSNLSAYRARLDAGLVESVLGLTPAESQVALWLAEGKTVPGSAPEVLEANRNAFRNYPTRR